jgi:hypothetical protein
LRNASNYISVQESVLLEIRGNMLIVSELCIALLGLLALLGLNRDLL